jgi:outer membrane lipoprotein SlyB
LSNTCGGSTAEVSITSGSASGIAACSGTPLVAGCSSSGSGDEGGEAAAATIAAVAAAFNCSSVEESKCERVSASCPAG